MRRRSGLAVPARTSRPRVAPFGICNESVPGNVLGLLMCEAIRLWLQDGVMETLLAWRATLDDDAWARAGEASRRLAGSHVVSSNAVAGMGSCITRLRELSGAVF